jgi:hypothetical protein
MPEPSPKNNVRTWHNGADLEITVYARSLQEAARRLIETFDPDRNPRTTWDAAPVIVLYRQAIELHLKALVGEGGNFLPAPVDHITLYKTHSLRWLAQIVCQIVRAMKWETEFKCQGVASLVDFSALINELEELEPLSCLVRSQRRGCAGDVPSLLQKSKVLELAPKLDRMLDLLASTAGGLAATAALMDMGK